jgi:hypothetical protein
MFGVPSKFYVRGWMFDVARLNARRNGELRTMNSEPNRETEHEPSTEKGEA